MDFKSLDELDLRGKRIFLRADFNVPLNERGEITDDTRIRAVLPTIHFALERQARVVLASHLGRPKGKPDQRYSLKPVARRLSELLTREVPLAPDCIGPEAEKMAAALRPGEVLLLENLRFHPEEEKNDPSFARSLAALAEIYVNDAFSVSHRAHASVEAAAKLFPQRAAGFLLRDELSYLSRVMDNPARPLAAVVGGAKVSGKLEVLRNLGQRVDKLIIGGGMAFTFLRAKGLETGTSLVEEELVATAREVLERSRSKGVRVYLPVDCVAAEKMDPAAATRTVPVQEIPPGWMGLDIGPATRLLFGEALRGAGTILWNGPMGVFEMEPFSRGTAEIIEHIVSSGALSVAGGGDTDLALERSGAAGRFSYVSTAGGAFLELLEGKTLPGVEALKA